MTVESHHVRLKTRGNAEVLNLGPYVDDCLAAGSIKSGIVTVFVVGSTGAVTTTEFEPGLAEHDLAVAFERLAPEDAHYAHEATWGDDNGHAHVRASLLGPSITVPLVGGRLTLGTWQQIVLLDFDTRPRQRDIFVQVVGD